MPDAIIIGAGIIGSSIAWRLAQAGLRVTLVDAGKMGGEASWAGAGMLAPGGEVVDRSPWSDFALESLRLYPEFIAELEEASGLSIDYQRHGAVELALTAEEWTQLRERTERQLLIGIASEPLDDAGLHRLAPQAASGVRGMFYPEDALVDPRHVMASLRLACSRKGVDIRESEPVISVNARERETAVVTSVSALTAPVVVLAAGAWSGSMHVSIAGAAYRLPEIYPVRGHLLGVAMEPHSIGPILRHHHTYVLQRMNGWTIFGTSTEHAGFDRTLDASIIADISRRAAALVPALRDAGDPQPWLGFRPGSGEPRIHRAPGSCLWLAYGHYRNGILLAPATARTVSAEIIATAGTGRLSNAGIPESDPPPAAAV